MLGFDALGALPLCTVDGTAPNGVIAVQTGPRFNGYRSSVWALTASLYDTQTAMSTIFRCSSESFCTAPEDEPADQLFCGRITGGLQVDRRLTQVNDGWFGGGVVRTLTSVAMANTDGNLDQVANKLVNGRAASIYWGNASRVNGRRKVQPYRDFLLAFDLLGDSWRFEDENLVIDLQDRGGDLAKLAQPNRYTGTGGSEGGEDLRDKTKPLALGRVRNVTPALVNDFHLIYQVSDSRIAAVDAVYDSGVLLETGAVLSGGYNDLVDELVPPGYFAVAPDVGMFKLGALPAGAVTADVRGLVVDVETVVSASPQADLILTPSRRYSDKAGDILFRLLQRSLGWDYTTVDRGSFNRLNLIVPYSMGYYIPYGVEETLLVSVQNILQAVDAFAHTDARGRYVVGQVQVDQRARQTLTPRDMIEFRRVDLPYRHAHSTWIINYRKAWTQQDEGTLALSVDVARRQYLADGYLRQEIVAPIADPALLSHQSDPINTFFDYKTDAQAFGKTFVDRYSDPSRGLYQVITPRILEWQLGYTVKVIYPRHGFASGKTLSIVGVSENLLDGLATLILFG